MTKEKHNGLYQSEGDEPSLEDIERIKLIKQAAKMYAEGATLREIASELGVHRCTIHEWKEHFEIWRVALAKRDQELILNEQKQFKTNLARYAEQLQTLLNARQYHLMKLNVLVNKMIDEASEKKTTIEAGKYLKDCQYVNLMKANDSLIISTIQLADSCFQTTAVHDAIVKNQKEK
jgi:transposase-like protein